MVREEKKELFSKKISAGSRTYFFDIKESKESIKYLVISESKKLAGEDYEHNRVMIFQEHIPVFAEGLKKALKFILQGSKAKAYGIDKIRQKYPKAYIKWTKDEDNALRNEYIRSKTIDELANIFQRKSGAIRSRIKKLGY